MQESSGNSAAVNQNYRDYDVSIISAVRQEQKRLRFGAPKLIDIGTGTAQFLIRLADDDRFDDFTLIGTDTCPEMLEAANGIVAQSGRSDRIALEQNDVHNLPYEDDSFEFVTSQSTIHQWAEPVRAFKEIFRVLKPNGVAVIHEPRRDLLPNLLVALRNKRAKSGVEMDSLHEKHTPGEVWDLLEEAGLSGHSIINSPSTSIGFEVRMTKSATPAANVPDHVVRASPKN